MMNSNKVVSNFLWRFLERCGAQGVTFIVSLILARLLDPSVYGTVALITVLITVMQVFVDSGMGNALIQKKDADELDFSSVFWFNLTICIILYLIMLISAPWIANFYQMPELTPIIRVLSLTLIISGVKNIQQAYVSRNMLFKRFFFATLGGTIGAGLVGIAMAYFGFGVWALVAQMLFNSVVDTLILWITVKWRPKKIFSVKRLKELFSFGWKLLVSSLLNTVYEELRQLIIGKIYSSSDLAYYNQGKRTPQLIVTNINNSIDSVLLPVMSKEQDNQEHVRNMTRRAIKTSTYIMMPFMVGMAVCAESMVELILTEKWLPCVPFLRIFCFTFAFYPIHTANLNAIKAMGRSDLFLKLEIIKKIFDFTAIFLTMRISAMAMAYSLLITSITSQIINSFPNRRLLNYSYLNQLKDILPQILLSIGMGIIIYSVQWLGLNHLVTLIIQILTGIMIYVVGSKIFRIDSFEYLLNMILKMWKRKES